LFEQQSEAAAFSGPWHFKQVHTVLRAFDTWHFGGYVAVVLKEVEVTPLLFFVIMGRLLLLALSALELGATFGAYTQL
jgi:hypothetical protein